MSGNVRLAFRLERRYRRLRTERAGGPYAVGVLLRGGLNTVGWLAPPLLAALLAPGTGRASDHGLLCLAAIAGTWFLSGRCGRGAVELDAFQSLRAPSRVAYRLVRWVRRVPWLVGAGAGLAFAAKGCVSGAGTPVLLFAGGLPSLQAALSGWEATASVRRGYSSLRSWAMPVAGLLVPVFILVAIYRPGTVPLLAAASPTITLLLVGVGLRHARTGEVVLPVELAVAPASPAPATVPSRRLPLRHRRGGPNRAALQWIRARYRLRPGAAGLLDLPLRLWRLLVDLRGPLSAAAGMALYSSRAGRSDVLLVLALAATAPLFGALPIDSRLWLFGVDYRAQRMARLRALIFTAALPTLLAAAIAAGLTGITPPKAAALAGLAAFFALRAGAGAIRDAVPYRAPLYIMAAAGIALIYREIGRASPEDWLRIAAAAGAVGVVGIVVERFGLSEERLRAGARDAAEAALRR